MTNILKSIFNSAQNKRFNKLKANLPEHENVFKISNANAQSWAPDLHNGIEDSSYVQSYDYDGNTQDLTVTYRNGFTATYPGISKQMAEDFNKADSKGRWAVQNLHPRSYR